MIKFCSRLRKKCCGRFLLRGGPGLAAATLALTLAVMLGAGVARAATEKPIHDFTGGDDGYSPAAGVIRDPAAEKASIVPTGTLFGSSDFGGKYLGGVDGLGGTLFMLTPSATSGGAWTLTVLHSFNARSGSTDGFNPQTDLIADAAGNLYGTTYYGDGKLCAPDPRIGCGTVFELSPPAFVGGEWTYRVLHRFRLARWPAGKLTLDPSGNGVLYGTTPAGGDPTCSCGVVFALTPPGVNGNTATYWTLKWLHAFRGGIYGANPSGSLVFDNASPPHLFGTASAGGASNDGVVFELLPPNSAGNPFSHWSEKLIHSFKGGPTGGKEPFEGMIIDGKGVLYGTTLDGGSGDGYGDGTVFEILPPSRSTTGTWEEVIIYKFGRLALYPEAGLLLDPATGKLYGTTTLSGRGSGSVFELVPTGNPKVWTYTALVTFNGAHGEFPSADLNFGTDVNHLYGTTEQGGLHNFGTVFEVTLP